MEAKCRTWNGVDSAFCCRERSLQKISYAGGHFASKWRFSLESGKIGQIGENRKSRLPLQPLPGASAARSGWLRRVAWGYLTLKQCAMQLFTLLCRFFRDFSLREGQESGLWRPDFGETGHNRQNGDFRFTFFLTPLFDRAAAAGGGNRAAASTEHHLEARCRLLRCRGDILPLRCGSAKSAESAGGAAAAGHQRPGSQRYRQNSVRMVPKMRFSRSKVSKNRFCL